MAESNQNSEAEKPRTITIRVPKINPWMISTFVAVAIVVALFLQPNLFGISGNLFLVGQDSDAAAVNKVVAWITDYYETYYGEMDIQLLGYELTDSGIIEFEISVFGEGISDNQTLYVTRDGEMFLPQVIYTSNKVSSTTTTTQPAMTCDDVPKDQDPVINAFVVSECPYGVQMQRILYEVVKNIPELAENIKVRYIGDVVNGEITAMHGEREAEENLRQICIREEQSDKYWDYVSCFMKAGNSEECLADAEIDTESLDACMSDSEKGITYAEEDFEIQDQYMVSGSPTLVMNGQIVSEYDFGGRTADALKTLLCCGFSAEPSVCSQELSKEQASVSFSESYSDGSTSNGSC